MSRKSLICVHLWRKLLFAVSLRNQFDQVGVGGRRVWIRNRERFPLLQMHLCDILESARDHEARIGEVKALAENAWEVENLGHHHTVIPARQVVGYVIAQHCFQDSAAESLAVVSAPCWRARYHMNTPMSSEQMQAAIQDLQDTMVVMAHIEKVQSEHISELVEFRIQSEKLQLQSEKLRMESEKFRARTEENLAEIADKLNGLIGYVAGQKPEGPRA
jgi:hypothetical protein